MCTPSNTWSLGPMRAQVPNGISIGPVVFAQLPRQCRARIDPSYSPGGTSFRDARNRLVIYRFTVNAPLAKNETQKIENYLHS